MDNFLIEKSVLLIGKVVEVSGRKIFVEVEKNKNSSCLLFNGKIIKNVSVGNFINIQKGFFYIIGKIDGEKITKDFDKLNNKYEIKRILEISLIGNIDNNKFVGGTNELPLIGNEAFIVTDKQQEIIYKLISKEEDFYITIAETEDNTAIKIPINNLFNSHIAIFGNTGSGKSNTLASLYKNYISVLETKKEKYKENFYFLLFDFNGEYTNENCITKNKTVYNLSTHNVGGSEKIKLQEKDLLDIELFSILSDATEKTQKPFLKNTFNLYKKIYASENPSDYFKNILKKRIKDILLMTDKNKAYLLLDYIENILNHNDDTTNMREDFSFNDANKYFYLNSDVSFLYDKENKKQAYLGKFQEHVEYIEQLKIYVLADNFNIEDVQYHFIDKLMFFIYLNLTKQVLENRANNEHIAPLINRVKSRKKDIEKLFDISRNDENNVWNESNFVVINMKDVNLDMKKMLPLLLSKKLYSEHKEKKDKKILTIIIDEAHNILSKESFRESEEWKDFRLETFEEIIKEGRKFGVFLTISSQRPNDISETIISQAHNYFIHRLINDKDLKTISNAVSYIDKLTAESIPTLPIGTCIFSGIATQLPLKINVKELLDIEKPQSTTIDICKILSDNNKE